MTKSHAVNREIRVISSNKT